MAAAALSGCDDFLDSKSYTSKDSSNFPVSETDVNQMVAAVYNSTFYQQWANNDCAEYLTWANLASDDMYGGGGMNDQRTQALDHLLVNDIKDMAQLWTAGYEAIARANSALDAVGNIADEDLRNQTKGELLFLRAYNYFDLAKCFGNIPFVERAPENVADAQTSPAQLDAKEIFRYIAADLYEATQIMPEYTYADIDSKVAYGKVTRWAAQALLARVFLFYTGFYNEAALPTADGCAVAQVSKDYVVSCLNDCIEKSGFELLPDFRSLWAYANEYTAKDYTFVADLADKYAEGDKEVILAINYMYLSEWSGTELQNSNQYALFFGVRTGNQDDSRFSVSDANSVYPFGMGWGVGPVAPNLVQDWEAAEPDDKRREASIMTLPSGFDYNTSDNWMEASGYHNKKLTAVRSGGGDAQNGGFYTFCAEANGGASAGHYQASSYQRVSLIRMADVYLMHSELTETADKMNLVRQRAGLAPVGYSLQALQNERRWELAFEGLRWDDIRRWHIAPEALAKQLGGRIFNQGVQTVMRDQGDGYVARYNATNGFYKIPQEQIDLAAGSLKQNAGWEGAGSTYNQWQ